MAPVELVRAVRDKQRRGVRAEIAYQVGQRLAGPRVGPVKVLDHEQHRGALSEALHQSEDRLEEAGLEPLALGRRLRLGDARGEGRQEASEVCAGMPDERIELLIRQLAVQLPQ